MANTTLSTGVSKQNVLAASERYAQQFPSATLNKAMDAVYVALDEGEQVTPAMRQAVLSAIAEQHQALDALASVFNQHVVS